MAIYYIKPAANGGSDSNNGLSASTAWATIQKALGATGIASGDTVYIAPGLYTESVTIGGTYSAPTYVIGNPTASQFPGVTAGVVNHSGLNAAGATLIGGDLLTGISKSYLNFSNIFWNNFSGADFVVISGRYNNFTNCVFEQSQNTGASDLLLLTALSGQALDSQITKCIFFGGSTAMSLNGSNVADTTSVSSCTFVFMINQPLNFTSIQVAVYNCTALTKSVYFAVLASGSVSFPVSVYNCVCNGILFVNVANSMVENYNRLVYGRQGTIAVGANSTNAGALGFDIGQTLLFGLSNSQMHTSNVVSPNRSYGTATNAPTTDIYGNPWSGANPDAGSGTYKPLSNPQYIASDSVVNIRQNTTSRTEFINLNSVGYKFNTATLIASYIKLGGTRTSIPLVNQTVTGAWVSGGFVEIDPVNMPGLYRFDIPDTVFSSSASAIQIINTANSDKTTITYKFTQEYKIDLTQAIPQINVPNTVGDALNAARAGTFGGMTIGNKELNYYSPTNAIIKTFTVDSNTYIRSKKEKNFIPYDGLKLYLDAAKGLSYSGSGSNWVDLSGNYNNGFLTNGPTYIPANEGIISFDGTDDYISFNTQPLSSTAFSIILNFRVSSFSIHSGRFRRLIAINGSGYSGDNPFTFFVNDTGQLGYIFGNGTTNLEQVNTISGGPTLEINKWYHATLTFNGTQKKLYIGGNLVSTITNSTTFTNPLNNKLLIGSYNGSIGCMQGAIGTVHVYDRALSDTEVMSNYAIYSNRYVSGIVTSGLMLYIDPNNLQSYPGSGIILYNLVGTSYNGIMSNGASFGTDSTGGYIATDGTNDYVKFPITRSTVPYTVFVFARILGSGRLLADDTNWIMGNWQGNQNAYHANNWVLQSGGPNGNGWRSHCVTGDYASDNWKVFANGVKLAENNQGHLGFTNITWGIWNTSNEPCAGHFSVFLIYDRVLTDAEVLQNHEALRGRYGI
jgi:hypothetical protein